MYVDDELVRQIFSIAGQIKFFSFRFISLANITAEIEYDHPVEAVQVFILYIRHVNAQTNETDGRDFFSLL